MLKGIMSQLGVPDERTFLYHANGNRKARLFTFADYTLFLMDVQRFKEGSVDYVQHDAGSVAVSYDYKAYTAVYGMCRTEGDEIYLFVGAMVCNDNYVRSFYPGGERRYNASKALPYFGREG